MMGSLRLTHPANKNAGSAANIESEIVRIDGGFDRFMNTLDRKSKWLMGIMIAMWILLLVVIIVK